MAVSDAQKKANKIYRKKNKEKNQYLSYRSTTRSFINKHATLEDLEEIKALIIERENFLKKIKNAPFLPL